MGSGASIRPWHLPFVHNQKLRVRVGHPTVPLGDAEVAIMESAVDNGVNR
jgi:hypothetical protein